MIIDSTTIPIMGASEHNEKPKITKNNAIVGQKNVTASVMRAEKNKI
jgi:hypothetical protein